jgi:hypothetical protein
VARHAVHGVEEEEHEARQLWSSAANAASAVNAPNKTSRDSWIMVRHPVPPVTDSVICGIAEHRGP